MERLLGDKRVELSEQPITASQEGRTNAVARSERIRELFSWLGRRDLGHRRVLVHLFDWAGERRWAPPRPWFAPVKPHLPYCAPAGTRNQERDRIAHWTVSRKTSL